MEGWRQDKGEEKGRMLGRDKSGLRKENSDQDRGGGLAVCRSILKVGG